MYSAITDISYVDMKGSLYIGSPLAIQLLGLPLKNEIKIKLKYSKFKVIL
jgi:hypothetical protein